MIETDFKSKAQQELANMVINGLQDPKGIVPPSFRIHLSKWQLISSMENPNQHLIDTQKGLDSYFDEVFGAKKPDVLAVLATQGNQKLTPSPIPNQYPTPY